MDNIFVNKKEANARFEEIRIDMAKSLLIDKETGVEYLWVTGALIPLVDRDGKPKINKDFH